MPDPTLVISIVANVSKLNDGLKEADKSVAGFTKGIGGSVVGMAAVAGGVTLVAGALVEMTGAAAKDRDEQAKLETAIRAAGAAHGDYAAQVDQAIAAGQALAFTDSDTRAALQSLVTATGDVGAATDLLATSQDVARFAGVDLATAADAVAKAHEGNAKQLAALIPGLDKGASATDTLAAAQAAASGQADTYAKSSQGSMARLSDTLGELGETIGSALLPLLDALVPALIPIVQQIGQLVTALLPVLIPLVKVVAAALSVLVGVLSTVVGWIVQLVKWLGDAIGKLGDFLDSINPLKGISLPSLPFLNSQSAGVAGLTASGLSRGAVGRSVGGGASASGIVVNVSGADPDAVIRALRRWAAANGGVPAFNRTLTRAGS